MKHKKFDFRTAYIDLLLNVLTGIIFLFILTTLLIQPPKKAEDEGAKRKAEMIATVDWPSNLNCDIDIWVRDPQGTVVSFKNKSMGLMHIERDDRGFEGDYIRDERGNIIGTVTENGETWTLRGIQPGKYIFNLHVYSCRGENYVPLTIGAKHEVPVTVQLVKVNPTFMTIREVVIMMTEVWQEKTVFSFTLDSSGSVIDIENDNVSLVKEVRIP